jgi:formylglycine-generating enzyme required for sulfatase activity
MEPILVAIAGALAGGLAQVGGKLIDKGVLEPALEPASQRLKEWVERGYYAARQDAALLKAVQAALAEVGVPTEDEDALRRWLKGVGLERLTGERNAPLRRQVARAVLGFTDPHAEPPQDLMLALGWPRSRSMELSALLAALRAQLDSLEAWRAPIDYTNQAAKLDLLRDILAHQARLDYLFAPALVARPSLTASTHVLPFDRLSPQDFERLCLWLVEREGYARAEHLGLAGNEQGRDVIAYKPTEHGEELWYFQCKRHASINAKTLTGEVDKYLRLAHENPHLWPTGVVFVVSCALSAKVREAVAAYCRQNGLASEFWGQTELDMRIKRHADLLREFFNLASAQLDQISVGIAGVKGLTPEEAAEIETRYRDDVVRELQLHDFRGIVQMRRDIRLPLADIYMELGLLSLGDEAERRRAHERMLSLREAERLSEEERRLGERVSHALARANRLVILGEPGAGKTISLHFIALMLAHGYGAARLGLEAPYIPLMVRMADFARELEKTPALSLDNFLLRMIEQAYASSARLGAYLRLALENGACMALLDGLDEVGDDPLRGQSLRSQVVSRVQQFADRWCAADRPNRLVVTSRIEGYWDDALRGFTHVQLSPLSPPDEVREFLLRWYTAHERAHDEALPLEVAEARAEARVAELLPCVLEWPSVRRLATNPLLLTILALIHENVGKLPNRRIKLYEIAAQTLIESWRQAQTGMPSQLLAELGEETVVRVMAPLAYWLHQEHPGGTAPFQAWRERLLQVLAEEGYQAEAKEIADRFLHHARYQAGLLAERGLGQFGFFHLTFEEYLAARQIARQRAEERRDILKDHWEDPRWQEVILLAAGQLGIAEARRDDVSDFVEALLKMEPSDPAQAGRQAVLAGRALADIGPRSVTNQTRRWVQEALRHTMQDLNPEKGCPHDPPRIPVRTRYAAGEALDELGWLPPDLNAWFRCPGCAEDGEDLMVMKYPLTNAQYERFILAEGYENRAYWGGVESKAWQWRMGEGSAYRGSGPIEEPLFWQHPRFGKERRGYPVVGISWYEANAYATWLTEVLRRARAGDDLPAEYLVLVADLVDAGVSEVRLLSAAEWEAVAGGAGAKDRYPWDPPGGPATQERAAILARANTSEAELGGTSPVAMYPLGGSQPFGLMDMAGNVWEWTATEDDPYRLVRGGSWFDAQGSWPCPRGGPRQGHSSRSAASGCGWLPPSSPRSSEFWNAGYWFLAPGGCGGRSPPLGQSGQIRLFSGERVPIEDLWRSLPQSV